MENERHLTVTIYTLLKPTVISIHIKTQVDTELNCFIIPNATFAGTKIHAPRVYIHILLPYFLLYILYKYIYSYM